MILKLIKLSVFFFLTNPIYGQRTQNLTYFVPEKVFVIKQEFNNTCWATVYAMLISWQTQKKIRPSKAVQLIGDEYYQIYRQGKTRGITIEEGLKFFKQAGMVIKMQLNPSPLGWYDWLRTFGPLIVTIEAKPPYGGMVHAILMTGIIDTGDTLNLVYLDPFDGKSHIENMYDFMKKYEAKYSVDWLIQIVHLKEE